MNNKSYVVLSGHTGPSYINIQSHPYTHRIYAEERAYDLAKENPDTTYYVAEIQTKYKATDVVVTELT